MMARRIARSTELALYILGSATLVVTMVYIVANALSRTLLNKPFSFSLEIVQFVLMPLLAAVGFIAATLARRHPVAEILTGVFPAVGRKWLVFANLILSAATLGVLVWFTWKEARFAFDNRFTAGYSDVPSWPMYFAVSFALLVSSLLFAREAWQQARSLVESGTKNGPRLDVDDNSEVV